MVRMGIEACGFIFFSSLEELWLHLIQSLAIPKVKINRPSELTWIFSERNTEVLCLFLKSRTHEIEKAILLQRAHHFERVHKDREKGTREKGTLVRNTFD